MLESLTAVAIIALTVVGVALAARYHLTGARPKPDDQAPTPEHVIGATIVRRMRRLDLGDTVTIHLHHHRPGIYTVTEETHQ